MAGLNIVSRSGNVDVVASGDTRLAVTGGDVVTAADGTVEVRGANKGSRPVEVRCAAGTDVTVGTTSGKVRLAGPLGAVRVVTASGRVRVESARSLDVRTKSGKVQVEHCADCRVVSTSSTVAVERADRAEIATVSGRVEADLVGGADVRSVSGTIEIGARDGAQVAVRTVSGAIEVTVPEGSCPATTLASQHGAVRCDCPPGDDGTIDAATVSGAISVSCR